MHDMHKLVMVPKECFRKETDSLFLTRLLSTLWLTVCAVQNGWLELYLSSGILSVLRVLVTLSHFNDKGFVHQYDLIPSSSSNRVREVVRQRSFLGTGALSVRKFNKMDFIINLPQNCLLSCAVSSASVSSSSRI